MTPNSTHLNQSTTQSKAGSADVGVAESKGSTAPSSFKSQSELFEPITVDVENTQIGWKLQ